jgi:hypothetical protein
MFIVQLGSIELLYVNAQPCTICKDYKEEPYEKHYAIGACLAQRKES